MEKLVLTAEEFARVLQISLRTARQYLKSGVVKGRKCGKTWRVHIDAIKDFLMNADSESNQSSTDIQK